MATAGVLLVMPALVGTPGTGVGLGPGPGAGVGPGAGAGLGLGGGLPDARVALAARSVLTGQESARASVAPSSPQQVSSLSGVSCSSASDCVALGEAEASATGAAITTSDGGSAWAPASFPSGAGLLDAVSCQGSSCVAVGSAPELSGGIAASSADGGMSWSTAGVPPGTGNLSALSCPSSTTCYAAGRLTTGGAAVVSSSDGGSSWISTAAAPPGLGGLRAVACPTGTQCVVAGRPTTAGGPGIAFTTDGGASWSEAAGPALLRSLDGLACASVSACVAVGGGLPGEGAVALYSSDGGASWQSGVLPAGVAVLSAVSCPSESTCFAAGELTSGGAAFAVSGNAGSSWSLQVAPYGAGRMGALSCTSASACIAAGEDVSAAVGYVAVTVDGGSTWSGEDSYSLTALAPSRICDTRPGNPSGLAGIAAQCGGATLHAGEPLVVQATGVGGVPAAGVSAVFLDVTATQASGPGYLTLYPASSPAPLTSEVSFTAGTSVTNLVEVGVDGLGDVAVSTDVQSVQVVLDVEGYVASPQAAGGGLATALAPSRICDTRPGNPSGLSGTAAQCGGKVLSASTPLTVQVAGVGGVPASGAAAAVLNVTVTGATHAGYLTVYPAGEPAPVASTVSFQAGETVAARALVALPSSGEVSIATDVQSVQVIVDVDGYVSNGGSSTAGTGGSPGSAPGGLTAGELFGEPAPVRICDTRPGNPSGLAGAAMQCNGHTLSTGGVLSVQATGLAGIPAGATGVLAAVTVADTSAPGFLTIFPPGSRPVASDLNWLPGQVVTNLAFVALGSTGSFEVYDSNGSADVIVDVVAWVG